MSKQQLPILYTNSNYLKWVTTSWTDGNCATFASTLEETRFYSFVLYVDSEPRLEKYGATTLDQKQEYQSPSGVLFPPRILDDLEFTATLYCNLAYLCWEGCMICSI